ncbi:MAG TPA: peptide ABC transporter substrate-binding protein [Propionibacteriaceae bacterium]|nr:peptide ABC transporter substrate-binding protein [Propionibacteriaceae bacterium]
MRVTTRVDAVAALAAAGLMVSSCSGGTPAASGSAITVRGCTPENPLIGTSTNEVCGGNVLDAITAKLVHYNPDTAAPELDIAKSIETTDATNFTVTLNQGYKFADGTEVKAKNFVDAWNWGAYGPNGQLNSYFFEPIAGYNDVQCGYTAEGEADCENQPPKAETMSGLKVVDDYTFTITTSSPTSNLEVRLGYTAFMPQPDAFFADTSEGKKTFGDAPVGAGPYKLTSKTDTEMVLEKFADYSGKNTGSVDKITFRIYNDTSAAYNDVVANNLDVTDVIPSDQLVDDAWKTDLEGRNGVRDTGIIQVLTFSPKDDNFKNTKMRDAISMGFDRALITKQIFAGARTPATGWVSPVVDGYKADACGENCTFDAAKAKQLYTEAGGYKGTMPIYVNGDGGHKLWADAFCNQLKQNLGMKCSVEVTPDFSTLRKGINAREYKGLYRGGWQMDYPSIENFLTPIYATGASSNDGDYSNPKFDALLKQAAAAKTNDEANALYQQAEEILGQDMPTIPLWYQQSQFGWSTKIKSIKMTPFSTFDFGSVVLN